MGAKNVTGVRKVMRGGKPRWFIDFRYNDTAGVRRRFRRDASVQNHAASLQEARRLMVRAAETGSPESEGEEETTPKDIVTFGSFVDGTFTEVFMPKYRPSTRERYLALLRQGVREHFGEMAIDAITGMDLRGYAAKLQGRGVQIKGPINLVRTVLRAAHEAGALAVMPELPQLVKARRKLPGTFTDADLAAVTAGATGWLGTATALGAFAGLRMGEALAIEVRDVQLEEGRLLVRRALSANVVLTPKSGDERIIPLVPELADHLREAMRSKLPRARVIIDEKGQTPRRQEVLRQFKKLLKRLGLQERSFHALRHSFASRLIRHGASVEAVRLLAGHSSLAVTERYVHATAADLETAMAKLGGPTKKE